MRLGHKQALAALSALALIALPFLLRQETNLFFLSLVLIWGIFALGFDFAFGVTGLLSFGHAAFFGIGGYILALLTMNEGWAFMPALLIAGAGGAVLALIFALIALRTTGMFFAILTLLLAQMLYVLVAVRMSGISGGVDGLPGVPRPEFFGVDFTESRPFAELCACLLCVLMFLSSRLRESPFGLILSAVRQDRLRAQQLGYNVNLYSAGAFMISGTFAGIAGGLNASLIAFIGPESLHWTTSGDVLIATLIGGSNSTGGPVIGALVVQTLNTVLGKDTWLVQAVLGLLFISFSIFLPSGLWGFIKTIGARIRYRKQPILPSDKRLSDGTERPL